ncbi:MAG: alkaline phosphatase D family protein [Aquabacterium sp.]
MMLTVWPQAAADELRLWIGVFGTAMPALPTVTVDGAPAEALAPLQWHPIRDGHADAQGRPLHHQMQARLRSAGPGRSHRVEVALDGQRETLGVRTLPAEVPALLDGSFNILLASCYYRPEDAGGLLGRIVQQLPQAPHLTLLAGDQIYGDLPLFEDLPEDEPALSQALGDKYRRNWLSSQLGAPGIQALLRRAPVACLPDDHEYWNNFPFRQAQLPNTWREGPRQRWASAAQALYQDWQCGGAPGSAPSWQRLDIQPLRMLLLDSRSARRDALDAPDGLLDDAAADALQQWRQALLDDRAVGRPGIGLLSTGQALFIARPGAVAARMKDAELPSYKQFGAIEQVLDDLARAGVPVVFITGDVHWGRVVRARHAAGRAPLLEVICSPSRLIATPGADRKAMAAHDARAALGGLFGRIGLADAAAGIAGAADPWPRHPQPETPPARWGAQHQFTPETLHRQRGDQVAMLQFARTGAGLELRVTYWPIHADAALARPQTAGPLPLLPG